MMMKTLSTLQASSLASFLIWAGIFCFLNSSPAHSMAAINRANDPENIPGREERLLYQLDQLPVEGKSHEVWSGRWYPYEDGATTRRPAPHILSPLEKYDLVTNGKNLATRWETNLVEQYRYNPWFGHCNGLAAAGSMTRPPLWPVDYKGVHFSQEDIKALLVEVWQGGGTLVGGRCDRYPISTDEFDRPLPQECLDLNPGTFHLVLANFLGRFNKPVILDIDRGRIVWNEVVTAFKLTNIRPLPLQEALALIAPTSPTIPTTLPLETKSHYPFNPKAKAFFQVDMEVKFASRKGRSYHYLLETDNDQNIIGGEWIGPSKKDHPDFIWRHTEPTPHNPHIDVQTVYEIYELSLRRPEER